MDLNQVVLEVRNFKESVSFYQTLGFKLIVSARDEYARFELPSGSTTFSFYIAEEPKVGANTLYLEVDDLAATHDALVSKGIVFDSEPKDERWLWSQAKFTDPTGNKFCLYHAGQNRRFPPWRIDPTTA